MRYTKDRFALSIYLKGVFMIISLVIFKSDIYSLGVIIIEILISHMRYTKDCSALSIYLKGVYMIISPITFKSDIYSLGVIIIEILI